MNAFYEVYRYLYKDYMERDKEFNDLVLLLRTEDDDKTVTCIISVLNSMVSIIQKKEAVRCLNQ